MVISIINEKGGSGKTTLGVNLAARLAEDGDNVLLIDADPQKSTEVFSDLRNESGLKPLFSNVCKTGVALSDEINRMKNNFDSIVVDTGGRDSKEMRKAMLVSNAIIIPTIPSQYDVHILDHMLDIYNDIIDLNPNLLGLILINRVSPNPFLVKELKSLKEYILETKKEKHLNNIHMFNAVIYERQAYRKSVMYGKSLKEYCNANDKALVDFEEFYKEPMQVTTNI